MEANLSRLAASRPQIAQLRNLLDGYEAEPDAEKQHTILGIYGLRGLGTNMAAIKSFFGRYTKITITMAVLKPCDGHVPQTFKCYHMHKLILAMDSRDMVKYSKFLWWLGWFALKKRDFDDRAWQRALRREMFTGITYTTFPWQLERNRQRDIVAVWWRRFIANNN